MGSIFKWTLQVLILVILESIWTRGQSNGGFVNDAALTSSIEKKLNNLAPYGADWWIFKVPRNFRVRRAEQDIFIPQVVSIGPFHRGKEELQSMETYKLWYLKYFLQRRPGMKVGHYVSYLRRREGLARLAYWNALNMTSDEFVEMMLVDGAFLNEFILRFLQVPPIPKGHDPISNTTWMALTVKDDMKLIENQLPYFIQNGIFMLKSGAGQNQGFISHLDNKKGTGLISQLFANELGLGVNECVGDPENKIHHYVDFFRQIYTPVSQRVDPKRNTSFQYIPSAKELHETGVKFKQSDEKCLLEIRFEKGVFRIPRLTIGSTTEILLRNLIVYESIDLRSKYITDYCVIFACLINSPEDVALLRNAGIIDNGLGADEDVSELFNKIDSGIVLFKDDFYYAALFEEVNYYYNRRWHLWVTILKRDYFNTPWVSIAFSVATVILICTLIQTVCAVISNKRNNKKWSETNPENPKPTQVS